MSSDGMDVSLSGSSDELLTEILGNSVSGPDMDTTLEQLETADLTARPQTSCKIYTENINNKKTCLKAGAEL